MDFNFTIPLQREDLLVDNKNSYSVKLLGVDDAIKAVRELKYSIQKDGCETILEHFEACFSFLYDTEELSFSQLQEFFEDTVELYMNQLCSYVSESISLDPTSKNLALNKIKMICYLFTMFHKVYEEKLSRKNENLLVEPKKPRRVKGKNILEESWSWYDKKLESFSIIYSLLRLPIANLWQTRIVEETFINMLGECCFKTFENTDINLIKSKPLRDSVSQVLSLLVANYNYTLTFIPRSIERMKQHEHVAYAISSIVLMMHHDFECHTFLEKFLAELIDITLEDPQNLGKPVSTFISELGESRPELFINSIDILEDFLSVDSYAVRNSVMITMCEMLINCFSEDKINNETKTTRNEIVKQLQSHIHDENAYVRSKVVQLWTKLALSSCIPINKYVSLLRDVSTRLLDKSINVSKNAIAFFKTVLQHNPYGGNLRLAELEKQKVMETTKLKDLMNKQPLPPDEKWSVIELKLVDSIVQYFTQQKESKEFEEKQDISKVEVGDVIFIIANLIKDELYNEALSLLLMTEAVFPDSREIRANVDTSDRVNYYTASLRKIYLRAAELDPQAIVPEYYENNNKIESARKVVKYLTDCIDFVVYINKASETIYKLMFSSNMSEILESIEFFSTAYKFQIANSERGVREMLLLINSNTPELKDAVAKAYHCLYIETSKTEPRARATQIANRLINLVKGFDVEQKLAFEEILHTWIQSEQLNKEFISVLFKKVTESSPGKNFVSDCNAALFLIHVIAGVNISIVSTNLPYLKKMLEPKFDNYTIKLVCSLLQSLGSVKKNKKPVKYRKDNEIFELSTKILMDKYTNFNEPEFINMAYSVVDLIYQLSFEPEELGNNILSKLYEKLFSSSHSTDTEGAKNKVCEILLSRLLQISGHIVFRKWQYCDRDVYNCLKRQQEYAPTDKELDEMDADNVVAANDILYEEITSVCESFLKTEDTIIYHVRTLVLIVCQSHDEQISPTLKATAALTLAKFMMTSAQFCEDKFQLYITMMDKCKYENVRSNLVLGFGDLLCRFPNIAEPWTPYLYSRLKDYSELVRMNTVSVLCHLISRQMIKVRGQFAELLLHMEDSQPIIAEKVKSLLLDLSSKGNTIYNVIPDIISKLSNPERSDPVASSTFKLIIGRLFELITKERQSDLLVEKLCSRLRESNHERQWEDLSYCLSQIKYSEKSLRKLGEAFSTLTDKLNHQPVYDTIQTIISTCLKSTKSSLKEIASEVSEKLEQVMTVKEKTLTPQNKTSESKESSINQDMLIEEEDEANNQEIKTPQRPVKKTKELKRATAKVTKTPKSKKGLSTTNTRSVRKKKGIRYDYSSDD